MKDTKLFNAHAESIEIENVIRSTAIKNAIKDSSYMIPHSKSVNHYNFVLNDISLSFEYIMHFDEELKGIVFYFTLTKCDMNTVNDMHQANFIKLANKRETFKILLKLDQYTKEKEFNFSNVLNQLKTLVFVKGASSQIYEKYDKKVKIAFNASFNTGILYPTEIFIDFCRTYNYTLFQYNPYKDYDVNYNELCKEIDSIMIKKRSKLVEFLIALFK